MENTVFWVLVCLSLRGGFSRIRGETGFRVVTLWGVLLFAFLFFIPRPHNQYLIFPLALLSIPAARQAERLFSNFRCSDSRRSLLLAAAMIVPWSFMVSYLSDVNGPQIEKIRYVLEETSREDRIYDGDIRFNIFRPDLHYFWFSVDSSKALDSYNRVSGSKFVSYDIYALIDEKRPVFISDFSLDTGDPRIKAKYRAARFSHLYRLKDSAF
jgi:hypothetical protein